MEVAGESRLRSHAPALAALAVLTVVGAALRIGELGQSLFGDELWSRAAASSSGLGGVLDFVRSDQEITPPLFSILAWSAKRLGEAETLIRLPSLIAGIALIPLVWMIGTRTVGNRAAIVGAALATLSPFLAFYSVEARSYSVAMAFAAASTLAMLIAAERRSAWWWAAYAAFSCAAMYAHYTVAFVLIAQLLWLLWRRPAVRKPALIANVGAAIAYLPWVPSLLDDVNSPSQDIIGFLAPFSFENVTNFTASWSLGHPAGRLGDFWGTGLEIALFAGIGLGLAGTAIGALARNGTEREDAAPDGFLLVVMIGLACPVGAALVSLLAADQFLPRNLAASSVGLLLALAALLTRGPRFLWVPATALVVAVFAVGAVRTTEPEWSRPDVGSAAAFIEEQTGPTDVVLDTLTPGGGGTLPIRETLGVEMTEPFQRFAPQDLALAVEEARGARLAVVGPPLLVAGVAEAPELAELTPVERRTFAGAADTEVAIYEVPAGGRD